MAEEQVIKLLEEIRDIHKEDLALRKRSAARLRFYPIALVVFLAVITIWLIFFFREGLILLVSQVGYCHFNSTSISEFKSTGAPISGSNGFKGGGLSAPAMVEIDGSGDVWVTSTSTNTMAEFIGAAAPVVTPVVANLAAPYGAHAVNKP